MSDSLVGFDVHLRLTDKHGKVSFERRRAWKPSPPFVENLMREYAKEGELYR